MGDQISKIFSFNISISLFDTKKFSSSFDSFSNDVPSGMSITSDHVTSIDSSDFWTCTKRKLELGIRASLGASWYGDLFTWAVRGSLAWVFHHFPPIFHNEFLEVHQERNWPEVQRIRFEFGLSSGWILFETKIIFGDKVDGPEVDGPKLDGAKVDGPSRKALQKFQ